MFSTIFDEDLALMLTIFFVRGEVLVNAKGIIRFVNRFIIYLHPRMGVGSVSVVGVRAKAINLYPLHYYYYRRPYLLLTSMNLESGPSLLLLRRPYYDFKRSIY